MLEQRYEAIRQRMGAACARANRDPAGVTLIAVTKTHPPETVETAARLGIRDFGENKVQEARAKIPLCGGALRWHGIGHLQTNKVRDAVRLFTMIHAVDSLRLAEEIEKHAGLQSKRVPVLLEVNVSGEGTKFGLGPDGLNEVALAINRLPHLELRGLMTMAPYAEEAEPARPYFRRLAQLKRGLEQKLGAPLPDLSMGMSGDYEVGIEEGATMIRVGSALFGERKSAFHAAADEGPP
ncbi:MAG: YggS family pyridoxal phosphate-dependent enzyme [Verrucomicrobia bacterium]|nr:YggS family pyridoxal phosphate-dependent enzyme [Verrucomicrobiota bacterium]